MIVPAHDQKITHHYLIHYPDHEPRAGDKHYIDFNHWRNKTKKNAKCQFGIEVGSDFTMCYPAPGAWPRGLEVHHGLIEFAIMNAVDFKLLEARFPGISDPDELGAWIESPDNLMWLCQFHHRGAGGVHRAAYSDYVGEHFVRGLITEWPTCR